MVLLYHGSGSCELILTRETVPSDWGPMRRKAVRYLERSGETESAGLLSRLAFEHWAGTNSFGDEFDLLYLRAGVAQYIAMERLAEMPKSQRSFRKIADAMERGGNPIRFIAVSMGDGGEDAVETPTLEVTSAAVERALRDFEALLSSGGAVSAIDRAHTALHGHLIAVCKGSGIPVEKNADITALFNLIRAQHPKFRAKPAGPGAEKILRAMAQVVGAMNEIRNRGSMAHPNDQLLGEPEAVLAANAVRSLLQYLNMKLS